MFLPYCTSDGGVCGCALIVIREIWAGIHTVRSTITENVPEGRKETAEATTTGEKKEANRSGKRKQEQTLLKDLRH